MEMITGFWFEKIKNPEMFFERLRRDALGVDGHAASGGENTPSTSARKTERAIKKFEACSPQQKLGYQVLYSILATLRKVSYTKRTVAIVKNNLTEATPEEETSAGGELEMRVEPTLAQQDRKI